MLQQYELETRTSLRLRARSEAHEMAHVRLRREDVHALCGPAGEMYAPIVALFSTRDAREPVSLRPSEILYVQLPEREEDNRGEAGAEQRVIANARAAQLHAAEHRSAQRESTEKHSAEKHSAEKHSAETHSAEQHSAEKDLAELDLAKLELAQQNRRRHIAAWTPLRVVAHHSYVAGMRVSGIMHRAIVRLEFDRK
jgi:hypothetical protein